MELGQIRWYYPFSRRFEGESVSPFGEGLFCDPNLHGEKPLSLVVLDTYTIDKCNLKLKIGSANKLYNDSSGFYNAFFKFFGPGCTISNPGLDEFFCCRGIDSKYESAYCLKENESLFCGISLFGLLIPRVTTDGDNFIFDFELSRYEPLSKMLKEDSPDRLEEYFERNRKTSEIYRLARFLLYPPENRHIMPKGNLQELVAIPMMKIGELYGKALVSINGGKINGLEESLFGKSSFYRIGDEIFYSFPRGEYYARKGFVFYDPNAPSLPEGAKEIGISREELSNIQIQIEDFLSIAEIEVIGK
jgi:hypothetical protein